MPLFCTLYIKGFLVEGMMMFMMFRMGIVVASDILFSLLNEYEPRDVTRKQDNCPCENKDADQLCSTCTMISAFVFATRIVLFLFFLNLKFQASSLFLRVYMTDCVGPGQKSRRLVFSCCGSYRRPQWCNGRWF